MARKKLLWTVYPYYLLIIFAAILAVWLYAAQKMRTVYTESVVSTLEAEARLIEGQALLHLENEDLGRLDSLCKDLGPRSGTRITVVSVDGLVLGDSDENPSEMENHGRRPEILQALSGEVGTSTRYSNTLQKNMMYLAVPLNLGGGMAGVLRTSIPVTSIDEELSSLNTKVALGGLLIVIVATFISLLIFRRISKPLRELTQGADLFAGGELNTRLAAPDIEEIDTLANAMNHMATQLKERIDTIARQRNEQEAVLASMTEGVVAIDGNECIINLNDAAAAIFDVEQSWARGRSVQEVMRHAELNSFASRALDCVEPIEAEIAVDGARQRYLRVHGSVLRDAEGNRSGAVLVLNDSTRLRRLESIRQEFVANVSHELKTPITAIRGFVETLQDGAIDSPVDAARFLDIIVKQTHRLTSIVDDLLSLSRIEKEADGDEIELLSGDLKSVVRSALQVCEPRAAARSIRLDSEGCKSVNANVNSRYLEQAVVNLIDNAIKYSDEDSVVRVAIEKHDDEAVISVIDQGSGIAQQHLSRLFERFYRVDKARSREVGGTGLGLAIVKHTALAHDGFVDVESTPGQGSVFRIYLPLKA